MAQFPKRIELNDAANADLVKMYKSAYSDIIATLADQTDFGRAHRAAVLGQIQNRLNQLGVDTDAWIRDHIPAQYQAGMENAIGQLTAIGANIKIGMTMTQLNSDALQALMNSTSSAFGEAMSSVSRNAARIFDEATNIQIKQTLAEGLAGGSTRIDVGKQIKQIIAERGVPALTDRGGNSWSLDRYADMLTRTKGAEARNTGLSNKMLENGYDLVQVSSHGASDVCQDWEGEILSLTGETDGYPTVDEATGDGLFHPNCQHALNAIHMDLAESTLAYNVDTGDYEVGAGLPE